MLLQLMVYAKIIYLLMVVISGALCTVEDYVIMSQCAHNKAIYLAAEGTVSVTDISQIQNITIVGRPDFVNNNFKIALYAKETRRYLCFNDRWKLVGMEELQDTCYFNEAIVHGYFVFRSVVDLQRRIGFTQKGRAVGPKKTVNDACYMFTKIPTDQFFHQHTHFSPPKAKNLITKMPRTEYAYTLNANRTDRESDSGIGGSNGSGNIKPNPSCPCVHHHARQEHDSENKKFSKQSNGNKQRQQNEKVQQQQIRGHSYNLSANLNSSRQSLILSQHSIKSHANKKSNNNNNRTNKKNNHPPKNHQVRHHHNDPNKVARRQQHDQKKKTKSRSNVRPSSSATVVRGATTTNSPFNVTPTISPDESVNRSTMSATMAVTKRKGRRKKGDKLHKEGLEMKVNSDERRKQSKFLREHSYTPSIEPVYNGEVFTATTTDNDWITNDLTLSSIKPTSVILPTWKTEYSSSLTYFTDENLDYTLTTSVTESSITDWNDNKRFSTILQTSSTTDLDKSNLFSPFPTSGITNNITEHIIEGTTSPTITTTDLSMTITNTSTDTQTDFWSTTNSFDITLNDFTTMPENISGSRKVDNTEDILHTEGNLIDGTNGLSTQEDRYIVRSLQMFTDFSPETTSSFENGRFGKTDPQPETTTFSNDDDHSTAATNIGGNGMADCINATNASIAPNITAFTPGERKYNKNKFFNESIPIQHSAQNSKHKLISRNEATKTATVHTVPIQTEDPATTTATTSGTVRNIKKVTSILAGTLTPVPTSQQPSESIIDTITEEIQENNGSAKADSDANRDTATTTTTTARLSSTMHLTKLPTPKLLSTQKTFRKSTQKMLATPFHQLTYVRNKAGIIDIYSIDNINIYPELLGINNDETLLNPSTNRLTMISGYLPTSATSKLPESIRIAKSKINRERKRMLRLRHTANHA